MKTGIFVIAGSLCCLLCQCARHYDQKEAERYIVESERQWAESVASGDPSAVKRILADDFLGVDPKGRLYEGENDRRHTKCAAIFRFQSR